ncbi:dipicolinic acid synthetase subunit A [Oceanobacillus sp. J11TS1]|uniref:dipicolinic acid synthetase subunit A n=1 Tax=Oceanobacillus sp. J11TS1 TaxID=2807191 RepID=UPI001B0A0110|nr:dipicolinic acid synthetase subunit A [Oceanobacillus sp. J11TS1]GIO22016.1 dipicolinate synthase subunit A [Oceanobacillus sp. J11TS1]
MSRQVAVIGGDARYLELIKILKSNDDNEVILCGFDKLEQGFTGLNEVELYELDQSKLDVVILPITGTDSSGNIETVFTDKKINLNEAWFQKLKSSCIVFTGISNDYLTNVTKKAGITLVPLLDRDDVAIYNSIPTAEGAIMMAFEHTDQTVHSSRVMVVGFGRVGNTVANKFSALGAKVSVCARSIRDLARITEMGLRAIPLHELSNYTDDCDILINTIPSLVVTKEAIRNLPTNAVIIDLASKPGGTDFDFAKKRGINAMLARSLPGIVAPRTAGKILANVIEQILDEERE